MSYQVLARKWRPQRFADVLGQQAVTRTLANALTSGRLAHAFVFAGPRGCGKTTTARLLARALNCAAGPTAEPCGTCEACIEIAEGRDIDVLEIDAATHTGVDNVREVIIEGLAIAPVRDRYKTFIIDEVHMLSPSSFNALLKSIEEPPPHVVFMMATTELHKIPDTVKSRSQVYEFRTISSKVVGEHLGRIAEAESSAVSDGALLLLARAGEGSMRDSLSALDQVRAFAGDTIGAEDVVTVLGLVGRDMVFGMLDAVADEDAPAAFALVEQAIERGYDLTLLVRELVRATRDLLLVSVDPSRLEDPDVAAEDERPRLTALAERSSREDLLRAFDVLTRAAQEVKASEQPRFNLEMALLKLMHLRQLVPLADLLVKAGGGGGGAPRLTPPSRPVTARPSAAPVRPSPPSRAQALAGPPAGAARAVAAVPPPSVPPPSAPEPSAAGRVAEAGGALRDLVIAEIRKVRAPFFNFVVAQAQRIEADGDGVRFVFQPHQKVLRQQCEDARAWLQEIVTRVAGRALPVLVSVAPGESPGGAPGPARASQAAPAPIAAPDPALAEQALADPAVQALFEIFPTEKARVEEV